METQKSLDTLAAHYGTDKATSHPGPSVHGYAPTYDRILSPLRDKAIRMLEVGVCLEGTSGGQSVRMWHDYFSQAEIYTFDIVDMRWFETVSEFNGRVRFFQGDQGKREDFSSMYAEFGSKPFDFILEDGSHTVHHQMISLGCLFKYVKPHGIYILEDLSIPGRPACCARNDENYEILQKFRETGIIDSIHLTSKEKAYLEQNVASIELFHDCQEAYATAIITKK